MSARKNTALADLPRYTGAYFKQIFLHFECVYYLVLAVLLNVILFQSIEPLFVLSSLFGYTSVGLLWFASKLRRVDKAFQSLPLNFSQGYGRPFWILDTKQPFARETLKIYDAGFSQQDFAQYKDILASRLRKPISSITKPSISESVVHVTVKKTEIPNHVQYKSLPLEKLENGEFYLGQGEHGIKKIALDRMIHMLVAGQTGAGKTQFIKQVLATLLVHTKNIHVCVIDMKGGIHFQEFQDLKNVEFATKYDEADRLLDSLNRLYEERLGILLKEKKENWTEINCAKLKKEQNANAYPVGPVVLFVDELAELSKKATKNAAGSELQEKIATIARLARVTGIHLVLGTQRPDVKVIASQSKDNLPTKVCFSVPNVTASTLVVGDMTASTLGGHPGRAAVVDGGMSIIQTPYISRCDLEELLRPQRDQTKSNEKFCRLLPSIDKPDEKKNLSGGVCE